MILVTLGTQDKSFERLLKAIDKEIENKNICDKVIVQAGFTKYTSKNMEIFDLIPSMELESLVKRCDILITHGGVGSILMGIKNNKKVIAAARLKEFKEHTNDHQKQIIKEFADKGYILELEDFDKLGEIIKNIDKFKPNKFKSNTKKFTNNIEKYIDCDNHTSWFNKYRFLVSNGYRGIFLSLINFLIFYLLFLKFSVFYNVLISYFLTLFIGYIYSLIIDVKYNTKSYIILSVISLLLELLLMYTFIFVFSCDVIIIKLFVLFVIMFLEFFIINSKHRR